MAYQATGRSIREYVSRIGKPARELVIGICIIWSLYSVAWVAFSLVDDIISISDDTKYMIRIDIANMHRNINVGDTRSVAYDVFARFNYRGVLLPLRTYEIHNMDDGSGYWVTAPPELGSSGWVLVVEFEDDLVQFVGVRMDNNWNYYPRCAPLDKGSTNFEDWKIHEEIECSFARCSPSRAVTKQVPVVQFAPGS